MGGPRWEGDLWWRAKALVERGLTFRQAGLELGLTAAQVRNKWRHEMMSPEERKQRSDREKAKRRLRPSNAYIGKPKVPLSKQQASSRPSEDLLAERDRRARIAPRDLTAALLGDPLPGFSALDRREVSA